MPRTIRKGDQEIEIRSTEHPFYYIQNELLDDYGKVIGTYGIALYNALARNASRDTGKCRWSIRRLAALCGMGERKARATLQDLERHNVIVRIVTEGECTVYILPKLPTNKTCTPRHDMPRCDMQGGRHDMPGTPAPHAAYNKKVFNKSNYKRDSLLSSSRKPTPELTAAERLRASLGMTQ